MPNWTPGYLFMLGRPAASKNIYVGPVSGPKNASNLEIWCDPLDPHTTDPLDFCILNLFMAHFLRRLFVTCDVLACYFFVAFPWPSIFLGTYSHKNEDTKTIRRENWQKIHRLKNKNPQKIRMRLFCSELEASCLQWSFFTYSCQL